MMKTRCVKMFSVLLLLFIAMLNSACNKELTLPKDGQAKIALLGELIANEPIAMRAGQSIPLKAGAKADFELLKNMTLTISTPGASPVQIEGVQDDASSFLNTLAYSSTQKISAGATYDLTAVDPVLGTARASVPIPAPFAAQVYDSTVIVRNGERLLHFGIRITDAASANKFYLVEVLNQSVIQSTFFFYDGKWRSMFEEGDLYDSLQRNGVMVPEKLDDYPFGGYNRLHFITDDAASEHVINGNANRPARRLLIAGKNFGAATHNTDIYVEQNGAGGQFPGSGVRTLLQVKSISEDYFRYLQGYEDYDPLFGYNNTASPVRIQSNVMNGVGIVGGVYRVQFIYRIP